MSERDTSSGPVSIPRKKEQVHNVIKCLNKQFKYLNFMANDFYLADRHAISGENCGVAASRPW